MRKENIVRSWKDEDYRMSLSDDQQALLPDNPAGLIELADAELDGIAGGTGDRGWVDCHSGGFFCPESNYAACSLLACPTGGWGPCSWFGCPPSSLLLCS